MRVIAGKHRGRRLATLKGDAIRPTTDRVRESLFSILGSLHDLVVIDGYAGTGALGCEALSRGASRVWFFDSSRQATDLVAENLATLGETESARVITGTFTLALRSLVEEEETEGIDVVFLDPPYGSSEPVAALSALGVGFGNVAQTLR